MFSSFQILVCVRVSFQNILSMCLLNERCAALMLFSSTLRTVQPSASHVNAGHTRTFLPYYIITV